MRATVVSVQVSMHEEVLFCVVRPMLAIAVLAVWLMALSPLGWGQAATTEETAPKAEAEQSGGIKDQPGKDQPSPPVGPPARIEGFRQARFGMSEEQVRQAIRKDFPGAAAKLTSAVHPSEKTTVLSLSVVDLLPHTGNARISYILGYRSKKLSQVNIVWATDGTAAGDETVVGIGYVPPGAINWNDADDNNAFHAKQIVMDIEGS